MSGQPSVDLWALSDLCTPWCLQVVTTLRIADHLANRPLEIADLAATTDCDAESLGRVLRHLVSKGLFTEPAPGRFAINEAAQQLRDPATLLGLDLDGIGGRMAH